MNFREAAVDFLHRVASGDVREAYWRYVGPGFRHHNPYIRGDAESLCLAMEENARMNPRKLLGVQQVLEDGERVAVLSWIKQRPGDIGAAVVHIFRFENDKIVELWDVGQPIPEESVNEFGMF